MRTLCLTLPEWPERTARAKAHLQERGFDDVTWVGGIHAEVAGLSTSHCYEVDHPGSGYKIGAKLTGVWLGHQVLWAVANALPDSHFLLLEDDVILHEDFRERMVKALQDVPPDFDFLFLGSCCCKGHPTTHIKGDVYDVRYPQCNHALIVAKKALPTILATQRKCYGPVDCLLIFHTFPQCKVYTLLPRCADQVNTVIPP